MSPYDDQDPLELYVPRHSELDPPDPRRWFGPGTTQLAVVAALLVAVSTLAGAGAFEKSPRAAVAAAEGRGEPPHTRYSYSAPGGSHGAVVVPPEPVHVARPAPSTKPVIARLAASGIPAVALTAYRRAAARVASAVPSCGIRWQLLAAIGRVESDHGRLAGAELLPDGTSTAHIIGVALDGRHGPRIPDTDGGKLDGDTVYDRAVGPMQFIPTAWAEYRIDGNGDGIADPFNINDAALAAARYLCAVGGDLRTVAGRRAAVLAYNGSDEYVAQVLALADEYARGVPGDTGPINGPTTGGLPRAGPPGNLPVNPADPPAGISFGLLMLVGDQGGSAGAGSVQPIASDAATSSAPTSSAPQRRSAPDSSAVPPVPHAVPAPRPTLSVSTTAPPPTISAAPPPSQSAPPPPAPLQSVVNGVLCSINLLGLRICPTT